MVSAASGISAHGCRRVVTESLKTNANSRQLALSLLLLVVRDVRPPYMLRKSLARGLRAPAAHRSFHASAPARRVVATNPVKAQEVQVCAPPPSPRFPAKRVPAQVVADPPRSRSASTRSSSTSTMPSSCECPARLGLVGQRRVGGRAD